MKRIPRAVAALVLAGLIASACSVAPPAPTMITGMPMPSSSATTGPPGSLPPLVDTPSASAEPIVGSRDGLSVELVLDRSVVEPGGTLKMDVTVRNDRETPAIVAFGPCGAPASVHVDLPIPWEPTGVAWDGIAGEFKRFALEQGQAPGIVPANRPVRVDARPRSCSDEPGEWRLAPGEAKTASLTLNAEIVGHVPALPGDVPIQVEVGYDRPDPPPKPHCNPICGSTIVAWKELIASGQVRIEGDTPRIVTGGEAIDALLADGRFAGWLSKQPSRTWSGTNLFLQTWPRAEGIIPAGPSWEIDLFREIGVPRNWAIAFVDPFTAEVRSVTFCNNPCDR